MWVKIDLDAQKSIDALIENARTELLAAGFPARGSRFPFAMHHGFYRSRIRLGRIKTTHAQVAYLLNRWTAERGNADDYARQAICGSARSMMAKSKALEARLPLAIKVMMASMEEGMTFQNWGVANCEALIGDIVEDPSPIRAEMIDELLGAA